VKTRYKDDYRKRVISLERNGNANIPVSGTEKTALPKGCGHRKRERRLKMAPKKRVKRLKSPEHIEKNQTVTETPRERKWGGPPGLKGLAAIKTRRQNKDFEKKGRHQQRENPARLKSFHQRT